MRIIFVGGVHGVGKTTLCHHAAKLLGLDYFSSSKVISSEKAEAALAADKFVSDVMGNQSLLIQGIRKLYKNHNKTILLDGHFCLLEANHDFQEIPVDVFRELNLQGIVVLHDAPLAIYQRWVDRDNNISQDPVIIEKFQELELRQAHLVANNLNIPIRALKALDKFKFTEAISEWIASSD